MGACWEAKKSKHGLEIVISVVDRTGKEAKRAVRERAWMDGEEWIDPARIDALKVAIHRAIEEKFFGRRVTIAEGAVVSSPMVAVLPPTHVHEQGSNMPLGLAPPVPLPVPDGATVPGYDNGAQASAIAMPISVQAEVEQIKARVRGAKRGA